MIAVTILIAIPASVSANSADSLSLYVWNFRNDSGLACTRMFETAMWARKCCTFLNRSEIGFLLERIKDERELTGEVKESLRLKGADGVIWGTEVFNDVYGQATISIKAVLFSDVKISDQDTIVEREELLRPESRKRIMEELAEEVSKDIKAYIIAKYGEETDDTDTQDANNLHGIDPVDMPDQPTQDTFDTDDGDIESPEDDTLHSSYENSNKKQSTEPKIAESPADDLCLFVWDFQNDPKPDLICTEAFEAAIFRQKCCKWKDNREFGFLIQMAEAEGLTGPVIKKFERIGAHGFIKGGLDFINDSTRIRITVNARLFSNETISTQQITILRSELDYPEYLDKSMIELAQRVANDLIEFLKPSPPDTLPPDTLPPDTLPPDTLPPDTIPPAPPTPDSTRMFYFELILARGWIEGGVIEPKWAFGGGVGLRELRQNLPWIQPFVGIEAADYSNGSLYSLYIENRFTTKQMDRFRAIIKFGYTWATIDDLKINKRLGGASLGLGIGLKVPYINIFPVFLDLMYLRQKTGCIKRDGTTGDDLSFGQYVLRLSARF